jgi:hypothetical protein
MRDVSSPAPPGQANEVVPSVIPEQAGMVRYLDPAAALAYRTPLEPHPASADNKAAALLTLMGLMFTLLGRYAGSINAVLTGEGWRRWAAAGLILAFSICAFAAVVQAFRTILPRFPKVPPSLAFFGDIARLSREEYLARVEALTPEQAVDQILLYNHTTSTICVEKFRQLWRGFRLFQIAAVCWFGLMALVAWEVLR